MDAAARLAMDVMRALVQKLNTTFWIRDPVRSLVLSKAEIMGLVVGFPVEYSDQSALDAAFADFPEVGKNFFYPYMESLRLQTHRAIRGKSAGNFMAVAANAYFNSQSNTAVIRAGILQPPVFISGAPDVFNYGGLGQIVGHEIMHGFDVKGIEVDYLERPVYYMATETMQTYAKKVLCLRASYQKNSRTFASDQKYRTFASDQSSRTFFSA
ncbi:hypothetical protein V5799_022496 [Amblyomma americanum]|uniref:Peptidase M13 C-terminal domain-containing protein n=1 Tax=Amblyomma americanum TaxID=6943 RepID=A0AAQ4FMD4_AMBAM